MPENIVENATPWTLAKLNSQHSVITLSRAVNDPFKRIKIAIWVYFLLIIFEGALRKWILPGLATPLLVIRDPVAFYIIVVAIQKRIVPSNPYLFFAIFIGFFSILTAMFFGHGNIIVAIYGARILILHFPLIFIIGRVFTREDVLKLGVVVLWIAIPMTILMALQFYSPQSAWVNRGVGGDESGAGFSGALGYSRPPGTFSFTNGNTLFYSLVAPFILFFSVNSIKKINRILLFGSIVALMAAIPLSISRALFFQVGISVVFLLIAVSRKPKYVTRLIGAAMGIIILLAILSQTYFFQRGVTAFLTRFETANKSEGGLQSVFIDRFLGGSIAALSTNESLPFFGVGIGMGTNVGAVLLAGKRTFLVAEGEWGRLIGELGFFLGIILVLVRVAFVVELAKKSYQRVVKGDMLPWLLLSFGALVISQGLWAQPTALGFSVVTGGILLASLNPARPKLRPGF